MKHPKKNFIDLQAQIIKCAREDYDVSMFDHLK